MTFEGPNAMCDFMTLGVPADAGIDSIEPALGEAGAPAFSFEPWVNEGGGHVYDGRFDVFRVSFEDQGCSCGVLGTGDASGLMDLRLLPHLAELARRFGEVQFLIHFHRHEFGRESFSIESEVELEASDLVPLAQFSRDTRYVVRC